MPKKAGKKGRGLNVDGTTAMVVTAICSGGAVAALVAVTHRYARTLSLPSEDTDADGNSATDLPDPIVCPRQEQRSDFGLASNKGDIP